MTLDIAGATDTQAESGTQPPAGTAEAQAADASGEHQPESISLEEAKKLRSEAASLRRRLKGFEDQEKEAADARLGELEKLQKRNAELVRERDEAVQSRKQERVRSAIVDGAVKLGFANPQLTTRLIDGSTIEFDDEGTPINVEGLLGGLVKSDPYLVKGRGSADAGAQSPASSTRVFTREQLRDVTFYSANKAEIDAAVREGRIRG